jgi:hypothetical protein
MRWEQTKNVSFAIFVVVWTLAYFHLHCLANLESDIHVHRYFRHWLNLVMLWSTWTQFDLVPYVTTELNMLARCLTSLQRSLQTMVSTGRSLACLVDEVPDFFPDRGASGP